MEIENYSHADPGFRPVLIRDGWQIGHLNFMPSLHSAAIGRVERHRRTDEAFLPIRGAAALVAAIETPGGLGWTVRRMRPGVTYNVPASLWHTIAMEPDDLVMIVEKSGTHLNDVEYRDLTDTDRRALRALLDHPPGMEDGT